jgi:hypothetical protein
MSEPDYEGIKSKIDQISLELLKLGAPPIKQWIAAERDDTRIRVFATENAIGLPEPGTCHAVMFTTGKIAGVIRRYNEPGDDGLMAAYYDLAVPRSLSPSKGVKVCAYAQIVCSLFLGIDRVDALRLMTPDEN